MANMAVQNDKTENEMKWVGHWSGYMKTRVQTPVRENNLFLVLCMNLVFHISETQIRTVFP